MIIDNNYLEKRKEAIQWLIDKGTYDAGVKILAEARYKPALSRNLRNKGLKDYTQSKLVYEIEKFIKLWHEDKSNIEEEDDLIWMRSYEAQNEIDKEIRQDIKGQYLNFRKLCDQRSILHKQLKNLGELNDINSITERKKISDQLKELVDTMDKKWADIEQIKNGVPIKDAKSNNDELPDDIEELTRLKNNAASRITRIKNRLDYQNEKKGKTKNPMPTGEKRTQLEEKLAEEERLLDAIKYKLDAAN